MLSLQGTCVAVAALMQYFFMAAFCWMLVEGIYLYLFVVKVYNINNKMKMYYVVSWGKLLCNELFYCYFPLYLLCTMNELITMVQRNALFYLFPFFFIMHCRFTCCYGCNLAKYCSRKRWSPEFCQWGTVSLSLLIFSFAIFDSSGWQNYFHLMYGERSFSWHF